MIKLATRKNICQQKSMSLDCAMLICCQNQQSVNADVCWNKMFKSIYVDLCEGLF